MSEIWCQGTAPCPRGTQLRTPADERAAGDAASSPCSARFLCSACQAASAADGADAALLAGGLVAPTLTGGMDCRSAFLPQAETAAGAGSSPGAASAGSAEAPSAATTRAAVRAPLREVRDVRARRNGVPEARESM